MSVIHQADESLKALLKSNGWNEFRSCQDLSVSAVSIRLMTTCALRNLTYMRVKD